jgi:hypothetical protein
MTYLFTRGLKMTPKELQECVDVNEINDILDFPLNFNGHCLVFLKFEIAFFDNMLRNTLCTGLGTECEYQHTQVLCLRSLLNRIKCCHHLFSPGVQLPFFSATRCRCLHTVWVRFHRNAEQPQRFALKSLGAQNCGIWQVLSTEKGNRMRERQPYIWFAVFTGS